MKKKISLILIIALITSMLSACGGREDKYTDSLRVGTTELPKNLNPYSSMETSATFFVSLFYNTLLGSASTPVGYTEGEKDVFYTASVEQQGLITIVGEDVPPSQGPNYEDLMKNVLWGDVNDNGAVSATDLVAMVKFMVDPETAGVTEQGLVNGNLYQGDKNLDLKSDEIMNAYDLFLLKKYILEDVAEEDFPIMDMKTVK